MQENDTPEKQKQTAHFLSQSKSTETFFFPIKNKQNVQIHRTQEKLPDSQILANQLINTPSPPTPLFLYLFLSPLSETRKRVQKGVLFSPERTLLSRQKHLLSVDA